MNSSTLKTSILYVLQVAVFATIFISTICLSYAKQDVKQMIKNGQLNSVYIDEELGECIGSVGISEKEDNKNAAFEMARTRAIESLGGYINGIKLNSETNAHIESINGNLSDSFTNDIHKNINTYLHAIDIIETGEYVDKYYAFARICKRNVHISKDIKSTLIDNTVRSSGFSDIKIGMEKARKLALEDALRNAVSQYNGVSTVSNTTISNMSDMQSKIATRSSGVVSKYTIISETIDNNTIRIEIIATIDKDKKEPEKMYNIISEHNGRQSIYIESNNKLAKKSISHLLTKNNFFITNEKDNARYIMYIESYSEEIPSFDDLISRKTSIHISVKDCISSDNIIDISNNADLSRETSEIKSIRVQRSMNYAINSIKNKLISSLSKIVIDQFTNGSKVLITFRNFERLSNVDNMSNLIESFPLTKKVVMRQIANGVAYYDILYLGNPFDLQMMIMKNAEKFNIYKLKLMNKNGSSIDFEM